MMVRMRITMEMRMNMMWRFRRYGDRCYNSQGANAEDLPDIRRVMAATAPGLLESTLLLLQIDRLGNFVRKLCKCPGWRQRLGTRGP